MLAMTATKDARTIGKTIRIRIAGCMAVGADHIHFSNDTSPDRTCKLLRPETVTKTRGVCGYTLQDIYCHNYSSHVQMGDMLPLVGLGANRIDKFLTINN